MTFSPQCSWWVSLQLSAKSTWTTNDVRWMIKKHLDYAKMMTHRTSFCLLTRRTLSVHVSLCIRNRWLICTKRSNDKKATGTSVRGFQLDDIGSKPFPKQPFENLTCKRVKNKQNGPLISYFNQIELQIRKTENVPELAIVKLTSPSLCAAPPPGGTCLKYKLQVD